ncbi:MULTISPECIES: DUF4367 domain-containing protein [unclassified Sedimentibacter]|uniref:DUF4367 domain-containing protein n=1 Tax=unclassified Sedimentibacter TaxID=2649220 RepID=UPI0027E1C5D6|nr:DUF4367 domain-containing protein [Sedimentibacter sp. MB35-C1]WMJ75952.1 DUF4367 domain-containing protein [Sedimentibacter sp. MB35-C1]
MTDEEVDKLMRRILLDALQLEWADYLKNTSPVETSKQYRYAMQKMLADPLAWYRKETRPIWKKSLQVVASIVMAFTIALGSLMAASPTVRAAVLQWVREWYDTHIVYQYSGEATQAEMPQYQIADLPEGYVEIDRSELPGYVSVTYQNADEEILYLDYSFIQQGAASDFVTDSMEVSEITVNGCHGQLFLSKTPEQTSAITWIDVDKNLQFTVDGFLNETEILNVAESVFWNKK